VEHSPSPKLCLRRYPPRRWEGRIEDSTGAYTNAVNVLDHITSPIDPRGISAMAASWPTWAAVAGARLEAHATVPRTMDIQLLSTCSQIEPSPAAKCPIDFPIRFFVHHKRLGKFN
jgi:hypothetical protein